MTLVELKKRVIELAIKSNKADLISDLQYLTNMQWLGVYLMLERLQGG
jgi:hypothetical protein